MDEERQIIIDTTIQILYPDGKNINICKLAHRTWKILFDIVDKDIGEGKEKYNLDPDEIIQRSGLFKKNSINPEIRDYYYNKLSIYLNNSKPIEIHRIKINKDWLDNNI